MLPSSKTLGTFDSTFETKNRFEIITVTVVACTKDHGLARYWYIKSWTSKLVNSMGLEEQEIGLLKGYKGSIRLKENYHPRYIHASLLFIHILPIVVSKLKKKLFTRVFWRRSLIGGAIEHQQLSILKRGYLNMQWLQNWCQPPDMFGFVSLTEYRNRLSRTRKYETFCENRF